MRRTIIRAPRAVLRAAWRALKAAPRILNGAGRGAKAIGSGIKTVKDRGDRRKEKADAPAVVDVRDSAPVAPVGALASPRPPVDGGVQPDNGDGSPNGDRGFPRLTRRSDTR
jgi:hypothetical protein